MLLLPLTRYREILRVLAKYGFSDLAAEFGYGRRRSVGEEPVDVRSDEIRAYHLRLALEELGPTYIKLGQVLSTRPDILPLAYIRELQNLQDRVPPFSYAEVRAIVEQELGAPIDELFTVFYEQPIASASLAQAHEAILRRGEQVIVKVQRPEARMQISQDILVLRSFATMLARRTEWGGLYDAPAIVNELDRSLHAELDFTLERRNLEVMARQLEDFAHVRVPLVYAAHSTERVLVLERVFGQKPDGSFRDPVLAVELLRAFLKQFVQDGFFHADPHPGNVLVTRDGVAYLLDLGMVGFIDSRTRRGFLKLLMAMLGRRGDVAADILAEMGDPSNDFDFEAYRMRIGQLIAKSNNIQFNLGELLIEATRIGYQHQLKAQPQMTLMFKTLSQIDGILHALDPTIDPVEVLRPFLGELVADQIGQLVAPMNSAAALLEWTEVSMDLPRHLSLLLDKLNADDRMRIQIEHISLQDALQPFGKWINRLLLGLFLFASTLLAGSLLAARVGPTFYDLSIMGLVVLAVSVMLGVYVLSVLLRTKVV